MGIYMYPEIRDYWKRSVPGEACKRRQLGARPGHELETQQLPGIRYLFLVGKNQGVAVDLVVMGQLRFYSLATATSQFKDPSYRLELDVDQGTASALRRLLETSGTEPRNTPEAAQRSMVV